MNEQDQLRAFHYSALHAVTGYDYFTRKWLPREGPTFYAFIKVLRNHCYFNAQTGEVRDQCFPSLATLAKECGVSRRTICRLIQRDQEGRFINRSLERFIKVVPRRRYDPEHEREVQTSNLYLVAMDDPTVPEDDHLVKEKEAELMALWAMEQTQEQMRKTSQEPISERQNGTQRATPKWHSGSSVKTAHEIVTSKQVTSNTSFLRSVHEEDVASEHIEEDGTRGRKDEAGRETRDNEKQHRIASNRSEDQFRRSSHSSRQAIPLNEEQEAAASVIYSLLEDYGDTNAGIGAKIILKVLIDAGVPDEKLVDLAYLGRGRLRRFQMRGGHIENRAGYYINLMRSLSKEAKRKLWDVERMEEEDRKRHEKTTGHSERMGNRGAYRYG